MNRLILWSLIVATFAGCQLQERKSTLEEREKVSYAAKTTADVVRESKAVPSPVQITANASGKGAVVNVAATQPSPGEETLSARTSGNEGGKTTQTAAFSDSATFPLWIAILGGAIGLILLVIALRMIWRSIKNTGIGHGIALANDKLAQQIHGLRTQAATEPDAQVRADLMAHAGNLERTKGDLSAANPVAATPSKAP